MAQEEKDRAIKLIDAHRRRLQLLEERAATFGLNCPPEVKIEIEDIQREIKRLNLRAIASTVLNDDIYPIIDQLDKRMNKVDTDLRKVSLKETRTFVLFGFTIWSTVIERVIIVCLACFFLIIPVVAQIIYVNRGAPVTAATQAPVVEVTATTQPSIFPTDTITPTLTITPTPTP